MGKGTIVSTTGMDSLRAKVANIATEFQGPIIRAGLSACGKLVKTRARELVSYPTIRQRSRAGLPHVRDLIDYRVGTKNGVTAAVIGPKKDNRGKPHGHLLEFGHRMVAGGSIARESTKKKKGTPRAKNPERTGKGTVIGFVQAYPFMDPALKDTESQFPRIIETAATKAIDKAIRNA